MEQHFDNQRIADLFQVSWNKLPVKVRRRIDQRLSWVTDRPEYLPLHMKEAWEENDVLGLAISDLGTVAIVLHGGRLAGASDKKVKFVIAHELAHVYLKHVPTVEEISSSDSNFLERSEEKAEWEANTLATWWGFSRPKDQALVPSADKKSPRTVVPGL